MVIVYALGFVGVVMWIVAFVLARPALAARRGATRVMGECIGHGDYISHGQVMYFPIFRVTLPNGSTIEQGTRTSTSKTWKSPKVGAKSSLLFRPGAEDPLEQPGLMPFLPSIILAGVGVLFAWITYTIHGVL